MTAFVYRHYTFQIHFHCCIRLFNSQNVRKFHYESPHDTWRSSFLKWFCMILSIVQRFHRCRVVKRTKSMGGFRPVSNGRGAKRGQEQGQGGNINAWQTSHLFCQSRMGADWVTSAGTQGSITAPCFHYRSLWLSRLARSNLRTKCSQHAMHNSNQFFVNTDPTAAASFWSHSTLKMKSFWL